MIYLGSRYENAEVTYVLDARLGSTRATVFRDLPEDLAASKYWYWREEDRLDSVSKRFYDSPNEWWRILDANPELDNPHNIPPGTKVWIP
jgi:hypothetical protein